MIDKKQKSLKNEIIGIIFLAFTLISFLSLYTDTTGAIGKNIGIFLKGSFGIGSYVVSALLLVFALMFLFNNRDFIKLHKAAALFGLFLTLISLDHLYYFPSNEGLKNYILAAYTNGINNMGGGVVAALLVYFLVKLLGITGSYILLFSSLAIFIVLITNVSIVNLMESSYQKFKQRKKKIKKTDHEKEVISTSTSQEDFTPLIEENITDKNRTIDIIEQVEEERKIYEKGTKDKEEVIESEYLPPPITLLKEAIPPPKIKNEVLMEKVKKIEDTLKNFGVDAKVIQVTKGPAITRFELQPSAGVKVSRIVSLTDDIALSLAAPSVRIEAPIPGKSAIGIEVPNDKIAPVYLREVIDSKKFRNFKSGLAIGLGKDIAGNIVIADLSKMPHLLIAGATGSGKSVCINSLIVSLLYKAPPQQVKMILIDPKVVELNIYNGIPHLLTPVVTDPKKAAGVLNWAVQEMTKRYNLFAQYGVRDIDSYNEKYKENSLYKIVIIIDELSDLMMVSPAEVEEYIFRLAQMARAAGIHLVIATQRPSVDVITGVIKANIPSRISFAVSSQIDSRTILDMTGAEKLLGKGDMLFNPIGAAKPMRIQGAFISEEEVEAVVNFLKNHSKPQYEEIEIEEKTNGKIFEQQEDELLEDAISVILETGQASISMLQRRLRIGYARAARIIDQLEQKGIISGYDGSKPRQILLSKEEIKKILEES
ncbi:MULTISPECIES: FtsK/SpoIIIE family DNA translocase [Thermoanaerobacter]|uniref:Cell divisionFtsK/SpoIIIE n=3 Tax=Thermoanaerobacter TaxID=1754 RepID=B0K9N6_THEP3|nr:MULTISPECIES: DNA translocase FtsK [Thermoanaerobacter]SFE08752.1 DNA translocase FtsK [Thermoanaerobacter thermohydrosulfuricus]ABY94849.1 cell divisionFtsK/SpoIIIE [Thermoanaerobacter pseudethanolicus ATCC 33223]ADV79798.1 cell division protein FtsK/SpoIIIE [Thermoanaerobacter brockii subsp. finnii Ako-1]EMT40176.1 DNA segregation ATPase FtsK/SpoIIIE [Thermoanaerobacter thermohydrosulfuricus WC1]HBW59211.1 DNA translocase FtsK [Thermoanaerobacter sp.]